jgi:TRAP transporter 4TM/12TM fusion protein
MESRIRELSQKIAYVVLIFSSLFALYTSGFGLLSSLTQRSIHWALIVPCIFLLKPFRKNGKITAWDMILAAVASATALFITFTWEKNVLRLAEPSNFETVMYIIGVLIVLEASRRSLGLAMPIIAIIALMYAVYGPYVPGMFKHKGLALTYLTSFIYSTSEGIFGMALGVSATYIIIFVLFGSFMAHSGAGQLFIDLSVYGLGRQRSGPARATIVSNALMGIISGSPVANVVTTGSFTVPLLERSKYPSIRGAAILAVAATGAMFTPPIMGAGAFLIADSLGVDYGKVVLAAIIPALLFYISLIVYSDIGAIKVGLVGLKKDELPDIKTALKSKGQLLLPIIILVAFIVYGWSPIKSAFWCIILIIALASLRKETRLNIKSMLDALSEGSKSAISIAAACACAGIIVGVISATGLGVKFTSLLMMVAQNNIFFALVLTAIAAIIMGMGVPPTAVYIIVAALTAPALISMGIEPMAAHFFIFFYSCIGGITPPVALTAYASAAIANTNPFKTGWSAFRMGLVAYIVPFIFAYNPVILFQGSFGSREAVISVITACIGVVFMSYAVEGYMRAPLNWFYRILFLGGAISMMVPGTTSDIAGIAIIILGLFASRNSQRISASKAKNHRLIPEKK